MRLHTFPGEKAASKLWGTEGPHYVADEILAKAAYVSLLAEGEDPCGVTLLAGKAVGAAFVGTFLSTLMLSELLRQLHGAPRLCLIDGSLRSSEMSAFKSECDVVPIPFVQVFVTAKDTSSTSCHEVGSADLAELQAAV